MQHNSPMLSAFRMLTVTLLLGFSSTAILADEESSDASVHLLAAESALERMDYLAASREFRRAAELSDDVNVATRATAATSMFGFDEDALVAARRWLELDEDSDEALFFVARQHLRLGNMRAAKRHYRRLLESCPGYRPPRERHREAVDRRAVDREARRALALVQLEPSVP